MAHSEAERTSTNFNKYTEEGEEREEREGGREGGRACWEKFQCRGWGVS